MNTNFIKDFFKFNKTLEKLNLYIMDIDEKKEIKNKLLKSFLKKYNKDKESIILFLENQYKILNEKKEKLTTHEEKILIIYWIIKSEF